MPEHLIASFLYLLLLLLFLFLFVILEEVRIRTEELQTEGLEEPLDTGSDRCIAYTELVRNARLDVHFLQEGTLQYLVHERTGQNRLLPLSRIRSGRVRCHRRTEQEMG